MHGFIEGGPDSSSGEVKTYAMILHWPYQGGPGAKKVLIDKNLFYNNAEHLRITPTAHDITVSNNIFRDTQPYKGDSSGEIALMVYNAQNIKVLHNTFYNNNYQIFSYRGTNFTTSGTLKNNIFQKGGTYMTYSQQPGADWNWSISNNLWYETAGTIAPALRGPNDLFGVNPQLDQNLKPLVGSAVIDAGVNEGVGDDYASTSRPQGNGYDIGAYEYESGVLTPTATPTLANINWKQMLANWLTESNSASFGDLNGDGKVNGLDWAEI